MSKKTFEERVFERKKDEARAAFAGYVQSVAFNMTLSRNMVDMLGIVRDYASGWAQVNDRANGRLSTHTVPLVRALERRGLVLHTPYPRKHQHDQAPAGWRWYHLTRAGELMCELLVEAGLLAVVEAPAEKKRKRAVSG